MGDTISYGLYNNPIQDLTPPRGVWPISHEAKLSGILARPPEGAADLVSDCYKDHNDFIYYSSFDSEKL